RIGAGDLLPRRSHIRGSRFLGVEERCRQNDEAHERLEKSAFHLASCSLNVDEAHQTLQIARCAMQRVYLQLRSSRLSSISQSAFNATAFEGSEPLVDLTIAEFVNCQTRAL